MSVIDPVRFSHLKKFSQSALHYQYGLMEDDDKAAYLFGRLIHYLVLGGGNYVVWEEGDRRGKKWDAFAEEFKDREIYKRAEVDEAMRIAHVVKNDPIAGPLLEGQHERMIHWEMNGRKCRSTLDVHNGARRRLVDLKSTTCSMPGKFDWEARRFFYHAQMAFYQDASAFIGEPVDEVFLVAVEKKAPYAVTCFQLTPDLLLEGRKVCRLWFERLLACERANAWPGYAQSVVTMDVRREEGVTLLIDGEEVAA